MEGESRIPCAQCGRVLEALPAGVLVVAPDEGVVFCNPPAAALLGLSREAAIGAGPGTRPWSLVDEERRPLPPQDYPSVDVCRTGVPIEGRILGLLTAGSADPVWVRVHARPLLDDEGAVTHAVVTFQEIEAQVRAEHERDETEERYRVLLENGPEGILIADLEDRVMRFANPTMARRLGYRPDEMVGMGLADLHPAESLPRVSAAFDALGSGEIQVATNIPCRCRDGSVAFFDVRSHRIAMGGRTCLVGWFLDLTERQRAERALQESAALQASEERYRAVVEDQTELICRFRADGTLLFVNDVFCRFFGRAREELVGTRWQPQALAEDVPRIEAALRSQAPDNPVVVVENRVRSAGGDVRWMQFVNRAFYDAGGRLAEVQAVGRDVTDRRHAQEEVERQRAHLEDLVAQRTAELARSEERYRRLVEVSPDAVLVHAGGRVTYANPAAARTFRAPGPDALVGRRIRDLVHPAYRDLVERRIGDIYRSGTGAPRVEQKVLGLDGIAVDVDVETVSLAGEGAPAALSVVRDITVQRRLEQEIRNSQKLESVGQLAGGIAHDFNNLLSAILGNVSLARLQRTGSAEADDLLVQAERAIDRAMGLTRQLLTFARGGAPVRHLTVLSNTLRETTGFALRGGRVASRFDIAPDLWPADVDVGQVSQVIHNLVLNARQAMPDGGTVEVCASNVEVAAGELPPLAPGRHVRITVRDDGVGIAPEHRDRIFEPYFTTKSMGSGLGLAVCHSVVRQHGGRIEVRSEVGHGTTFVIHLPAADGGAVDDSRAEARAADRAGGEGVLLMDDDEGLRFTMVRLLRALGYRPEAVADGGAAVAAYARARAEGQPFDAVILDLTVPGGMGGQEAAARLLEMDPEARLIVSSGYSDDPVMARPEAYGFRGVLPKPCHVDAVGAVLRRVLHGDPVP